MNRNLSGLIIIVVGLVMGYILGFAMGGIQTLKWGLGIAENFMEIEIDEDMVAHGIWNYKNRVSNCFEPTIENALIYDYTGNQT